MSLPIAPTPVLKGKDAERFEAMVKEGLKHPCGPVPTPGLDQARELILNTLNEENDYELCKNYHEYCIGAVCCDEADIAEGSR